MTHSQFTLCNLNLWPSVSMWGPCNTHTHTESVLWHFTTYAWVRQHQIFILQWTRSQQPSSRTIRLSCSSLGVPHFLFLVAKWGTHTAEPAQFIHLSMISLGFVEVPTAFILATCSCWWQLTVLKKCCRKRPSDHVSFRFVLFYGVHITEIIMYLQFFQEALLNMWQTVD